MSADGRAPRHGTGHGPEPLTGPVAPDPAAVDTLLRVLQARTGFDLTGYRLDGLARRSAHRARLVGEPDLEAYVQRVARDDSEAGALLEHLLVQVSGWYRDPHVWQVLRTSVLPGLVSRAVQGGLPVRAWVAGCGDGEEVFTLAACLAEAGAAGDRAGPGWSVLATDVDVRALHVLAGARYPRSTPVPHAGAGLLRPHLQDDGPGVLVSAPLRAGVSWLRHDVRRPPPVDDGPFDLVLCRNLLMYLDDVVQVGVVDHLVAAVRPGGVVVLGQAELPLGRREALVPLDQGARVYRSIAQPLVRGRRA